MKLDPLIFRLVCEKFDFYPKMDLFASEKHHQLRRYYSVNSEDFGAMGMNAFNYHWDPRIQLYANPPWTLIWKMLAKIWNYQATVLVVTPEFTRAP